MKCVLAYFKLEALFTAQPLKVGVAALLSNRFFNRREEQWLPLRREQCSLRGDMTIFTVCGGECTRKKRNSCPLPTHTIYRSRLHALERARPRQGSVQVQSDRGQIGESLLVPRGPLTRSCLRYSVPCRTIRPCSAP